MEMHKLIRRASRWASRKIAKGYDLLNIEIALLHAAMDLHGEGTGRRIDHLIVSRNGKKFQITDRPARPEDHEMGEDATSIAYLTKAFGEMTVKAGDAFHVKIDDDRNGFSVETAKGVSPQMTETALRQAMHQFFAYEKAHRAKGTPDGDEKASVNHEMALLMARALGEEDDTKVGMLGLLPLVPDDGGFALAVEHLVERGYEIGMDHDAMMRALLFEVFNIGSCHGWNDDTRLVFGPIRDGKLHHQIVAPTTPIGQGVAVRAENPAVQRDSDDPAPSTPLASATAILAWLRGKAEYARKRGDTDIQRQLLALCEGIEKDLVDDLPVDPMEALRQFYSDCHGRNVKAGWWNDLATGTPKKRSVGELFILIVTELAEAYKAYVARDNDDKLPHLPGLGVELGDVQIRLADFAGALLEGSIVEHTGVRNPGDEMFREIVAIADRYESIRKTDAAKGDEELGESVGKQDVAAMTFEKLAFNAQRPDHKIENRLKADGKRT